MLPAILIAGGVFVEAVLTWRREGSALAWPRVVAAALALVPVCWCFRLASSRAAWVGLVVGVAGLLFLRAKRWVRLLIVVITVAVGGLGTWYMSSANQELAMARGATIRFRFYAWRYAAALWSQHALKGVGAGQYPRLAGHVSLMSRDRILDPAAFQAEAGLVEHAHNELFEIFAEIGLVGGVTYVGGIIATLAAASALLRANLSAQRRWLLYGLVAAVIALLGDSMFGVGLRLPGVPALFYTLLGALWAVCRSMSKMPAAKPRVVGLWARTAVWRRQGLAAASLGAAIIAGWLTLYNWSGVQHEYAAETALREGDYDRALVENRAARQQLLDPVRQLIAEMRDVDCLARRATRAQENALDAIRRFEADRGTDDQRLSSSATSLAEFVLAENQGRDAFAAVLRLRGHVPSFVQTAAIGAYCAELMAALYDRIGDRERAMQWTQSAIAAWTDQRRRCPFESQTLINLAKYPVGIGEYIGLLRDALRAGFPSARWHEALQRRANDPDFERSMQAMVRAVGPYDPQTNLDTLILSRAPEMYRLSAQWKALRGQHAEAAADAARAVLLYRPMRPRFPELYSVALAEQAKYASLANRDQPHAAIALAREAIRSLPTIQRQKYDRMVAPYRLDLAQYLLTAGETAEALDLLNRVLDEQPDNLKVWMLLAARAVNVGEPDAVRAVLNKAVAAGVCGEGLERLREFVWDRMPEALEPAQD